MDFPSINSPTGRQETQATAPRQPRSVFSAWYLLLLMVAAVFGPCTAIQIPREIGRWRLAEALRLREAGEKEAAYQRLTQAVGWFPKSMELRLTRAEWLLADGKRDEALEAIDQMLTVAGSSVENLMIHSQFLQTAGEFEKAVEDWKQLSRQSEVSGRPSRANALNGLAYAQGLANIELDQALANVNKALEGEPANAAYLDTRGYIYYRQAKSQDDAESAELLAKALEDLDKAAKAIDGEVAKQTPRIARQVSEPVQKALEARPKTLRDMVRGNQENWIAAVMHYHRALVLESLGRTKEAAAERGVVRRLIGREPDETLF
jgi:tetratricopeptide (TPR) repeat protein